MHLLRLMLCILVMAGIAAAQVTETKIQFSDLESLARQNSPDIQNTQYDYQLQINERKAALAFSNPEVEFEQERLTNNNFIETERQFLLSKSFAMPWSYLKKRQRWDLQIAAAEHVKRERIRETIREIKTGYVKLYMQKNQLKRLNKTQLAIQSLSATTRSQHREGAISGLEQQLIKTALFNLNTTLVEMRSAYKVFENHWKNLIGFDDKAPLKLGSAVNFVEVTQHLNETPGSLLENNATLSAMLKEQMAGEKAVGEAKANIIPEFHFAAGFKKTSTDFEGAVVGLSIPLPLLNLNKTEIERQKIVSASRKNRYRAAERELQRTVSTLPQIIMAHENLLKSGYDPYLNSEKFLQQIILSYKEGWLSLSDMLSALQVYIDGINRYSDQIIDYYEAVFHLEAISGKQFVSF